MAAAKLLCAALACLQLAAADETAGECNAVVLTALPEAAVEYNSRFDESYSTYHKYPVALQHLATAATEEVLDAQKARNVFRSTPRVEISAGVVPTTRFCGLTYPSGPGGYDCAPVNTELQDAAFLQNCYDVMPTGNATCKVGKEMVDYISSLAAPLAIGIALGVVFPILCIWWYLHRVCGCLGGRKHSAGILCTNTSCSAVFCKVCSKKGVPPGYSKMQVLIFKGLFLLFFLLAFIAGAIGFAGDGLLGAGLSDSIDIFLHGIAQKVASFETLVGQIKVLANGAGAPLDPSDTEMITTFGCFVGNAQKTIQENGPNIFTIRSLAVLCVCLVPMLVTVIGIVAAFCNWKHLSCCVAIQIGWLMLIVWISFGLHGLLGIVFGDLCTEMDLVLQTPVGEYVAIGFIPMMGEMCGRDGQFSGLTTMLSAEAAAPLADAAEVIRDLCNKAGSFSSVPFTVDCAAIVGAGKVLSGSAGSYTVGTVTINNFPGAFTQIQIGDPGLTSSSCLDSPPVVATPSNKCPDVDSGTGASNIADDCVPSAGWLSAQGVNAGTPSAWTPQPAQETMRFLDECAVVGDAVDGCQFPAAYELACSIMSETAVLTKVQDLADLLDTEIKPLEKCEWVKDMFKGMYMPLCVDAVYGFEGVTLSNAFGGVIMLMMLPFLVIATKRLDPKNSGNKIAELMTGDTESGTTPRGDVTLSVPVHSLP